MNNPPEDRYTNTVDGAAAYEALRSKQEGLSFEEDEFYYDDDYCDDDHNQEDYDICGCRDPGCPCDGPKRGGPPF